MNILHSFPYVSSRTSQCNEENGGKNLPWAPVCDSGKMDYIKFYSFHYKQPGCWINDTIPKCISRLIKKKEISKSSKFKMEVKTGGREVHELAKSWYKWGIIIRYLRVWVLMPHEAEDRVLSLCKAGKWK